LQSPSATEHLYRLVDRLQRPGERRRSGFRLKEVDRVGRVQGLEMLPTIEEKDESDAGFLRNLVGSVDQKVQGSAHVGKLDNPTKTTVAWKLCPEHPLDSSIERNQDEVEDYGTSPDAATAD
jgi:hypothetical protein